MITHTMALLTTFTSTTVLLCLMSAIPVEADILSHLHCISCVCRVTSNSPDCIANEVCTTDSDIPERQQLSRAQAKTVNRGQHANVGRVMQGVARPVKLQPRTSTFDHNNKTQHTPKVALWNNYSNMSNTDVFTNFANNNNNNNKNNSQIQHVYPKNNGFKDSNGNPSNFPGRPKRSCGSFNLDIHYYISCGRPGIQPGDGDITAFQRCATNADCAKSCIQNYTTTFETKCPGPPKCEIWSRIHFGYFMGLSDGSGCKSDKTLPWWSEVQDCLLNKPAPTKHNKSITNFLTNFHAKVSSLHIPNSYNNSTHKRIPPILVKPVVRTNFSTPLVSNRARKTEHKIDRPHVERPRVTSSNSLIPRDNLPKIGGIQVGGASHSTNTDDIHSFHLDN